MTEAEQGKKQDGQVFVDAKWLRPHPRLCDWFGTQVSEMEIAPLKEAINGGDTEKCPAVVILEDGTVVKGWVTVCAYRALETGKIPVSYRAPDGEHSPMATPIVAEVVKDALETRRIHDLMAADVFRQFWEDSGETMAKLAKLCGLGKTLRTWRRRMELLGLPREVLEGIEAGHISRAQGKLINGLPDEWKRSLAAALQRGENVRDALIDCGVVDDDHGLSPHDSACRVLNLFARYLELWRENPKGFRSAYVLGGKDKLELIRQAVHFLTYVRDELISDQRRAVTDRSSLPSATASK